MDIGARVKYLRKALGLTQKELAIKCGYKSLTTINKIELGINNVPLDVIEKLASALQVTPAYLMGWQETKEEKNPPQDKMNLSEGEIMLLDLFNRVPEEKQKLVIEMIRVALGNL
jgi:transcriptional regulator with XRE-family HTH domain